MYFQCNIIHNNYQIIYRWCNRKCIGVGNMWESLHVQDGFCVAFAWEHRDHWDHSNESPLVSSWAHRCCCWDGQRRKVPWSCFIRHTVLQVVVQRTWASLQSSNHETSWRFMIQTCVNLILLVYLWNLCILRKYHMHLTAPTVHSNHKPWVVTRRILAFLTVLWQPQLLVGWGKGQSEEATSFATSTASSLGDCCTVGAWCCITCTGWGVTGNIRKHLETQNVGHCEMFSCGEFFGDTHITSVVFWEFSINLTRSSEKSWTKNLCILPYRHGAWDSWGLQPGPCGGELQPIWVTEPNCSKITMSLEGSTRDPFPKEEPMAGW